MTSREIRQAFLEFFSAKDHRVVPSSPLVLPRDPTLLFANAGMNQFKDVFTGRDKRDYLRAATSQKCLRVSGKHNDLEMVGRTPRHHTFFEMLGNFSFGDYFKEDAARFAWELMTEVFGIPADRLWVTVFGGTEELEADDAAYRVWIEQIGVPAERILRLGEKDNFWRMGETGPCGPCSELHYDLGPELTSVDGPSNPETDERRFMEVWNLVFMEFDQREDGSLVELPSKSVDTGMGLERLAAVLQGKSSNFDTDLFRPLIETTARRAGVSPDADAETDFSLRVIADHARALCFLVADGVMPANDRRGYVLRRLLRRAIRHGRKLGLDEPFLHDVTPVVIDSLGEVYPELPAAREAIVEVGRREEERFAETLAAGLTLLEGSLAKLEDAAGEGPRVLPGDELFRLHDTYGFPLELARDIAEERGVLLDEAGFEERMAGQRALAQASWKGAAGGAGDESYVELARRFSTEFQGYERERLEDVPVLALLRGGRPVDLLSAGEEGEIILEATPFYAESGGQVADSGFVVAANGRARIVDVRRPREGLMVHRALIEQGELRVGDRALAEIDASRRAAIRRNHTATHLLHAALREVLGTHVKQAGSLVAADRLRFDFSHFSALSDRAKADVESLVNCVVLRDLPVEIAESDREQALGRGAMALFGEKYGDRVRTVRIGEFSLELCGGTHTARTGEIGLIKLTEEHGIASGVRRVEAVSGETSLERFREDHGTMRRLEEQLSVPRERVFDEVERRLAQLKELQRAVEKQRLCAVRERLNQKAAQPNMVAGVGVLTERVDGLSPQEMRELADSLRGKLKSGVVVLGRAAGEKASVLVAVTEDLKQRLPAGELVRELGPLIGGGGGGRPDMAEAGGKNAAGLDAALEQAIEAVGRRLEETT